ncbi:MAG: hypothetical protein E6G28_10400 [Actinobacteria bacterium]|nr:MAG: hypothetical protein E6G28_10400 [Actinomycetota bacterium]
MQIALTVLAILGTLGGAWIGSAIPSRYQERIERKREQAEIRAARRLIANELNVLAAHLKAVAELGKPPPGPIHNLLPMEAWGEQRLVLARAKEIDILEWRRIRHRLCTGRALASPSPVRAWGGRRHKLPRHRREG